MASMPRAVARWVFPVPTGPTRTTLRVAPIQAQRARSSTRARSRRWARRQSNCERVFRAGSFAARTRSSGARFEVPHDVQWSCRLVRDRAVGAHPVKAVRVAPKGRKSLRVITDVTWLPAREQAREETPAADEGEGLPVAADEPRMPVLS